MSCQMQKTCVPEAGPVWGQLFGYSRGLRGTNLRPGNLLRTRSNFSSVSRRMECSANLALRDSCSSLILSWGCIHSCSGRARLCCGCARGFSRLYSSATGHRQVRWESSSTYTASMSLDYFLCVFKRRNILAGSAPS